MLTQEQTIILYTESISAGLITSILGLGYFFLFYHGRFPTRTSMLQLALLLSAFFHTLFETILFTGLVEHTLCWWQHVQAVLMVIFLVVGDCILLLCVIDFLPTRRYKVLVASMVLFTVTIPRVVNLSLVKVDTSPNDICVIMPDRTAGLATYPIYAFVNFMAAVFFSVVLIHQSCHRPVLTAAKLKRLGTAHGICFVLQSMLRTIFFILFLISALETMSSTLTFWMFITDMVLINTAIHFSLDSSGLTTTHNDTYVGGYSTKHSHVHQPSGEYHEFSQISSTPLAVLSSA